MNANKVKEFLPILNAFANKQSIQHRNTRIDGKFAVGRWMDINPDTTEFRLTDDMEPEEWRVKPIKQNGGQDGEETK